MGWRWDISDQNLSSVALHRQSGTLKAFEREGDNPNNPNAEALSSPIGWICERILDLESVVPAVVWVRYNWTNNTSYLWTNTIQENQKDLMHPTVQIGKNSAPSQFCKFPVPTCLGGVGIWCPLPLPSLDKLCCGCFKTFCFILTHINLFSIFVWKSSRLLRSLVSLALINPCWNKLMKRGHERIHIFHTCFLCQKVKEIMSNWSRTM